jgi:hypothetical protein
MFVIITVAIYGAILGMTTRPAARAVVFAAISVAAIQYSAIYLSHTVLRGPGVSGLAASIQFYAGDQARDVVPTASAAAFAAMIAAAISAMSRSGEARRRGRRVAAIED